MTYGPFDVWAPRPTRVRLAVAGETIEMVRGDDDWWTPTGPVPDPDGEEVDYGYLIDDDDTPRPDPLSRRQPDGVHGLSRTHDSTEFEWHDAGWTGRQLAGSVIYELHVGDLHPRGHLRRRDRPARPPARARRRRRRGDAGRRVQRHAATGATTASSVRRRTRGTAAPRGTSASSMVATRGARRDPGRGLQPPRAVGQLPAAVRSLPHRPGTNTWGDLVNLDDEGSTRCAATSWTTS